jgi:hypothetical protein
MSIFVQHTTVDTSLAKALITSALCFDSTSHQPKNILPASHTHMSQVNGAMGLANLRTRRDNGTMICPRLLVGLFFFSFTFEAQNARRSGHLGNITLVTQFGVEFLSFLFFSIPVVVVSVLRVCFDLLDLSCLWGPAKLRDWGLGYAEEVVSLHYRLCEFDVMR